MNVAVVTKILILFLIIISSLQCFAEENFSAYKKMAEDRFKEHERKAESEFNDYKAEIEKLWDEFRESTQSQWVEYYNDNHTRSIVDFKNGEIIIETVGDPATTSGKVAAGRKLGESLKKIIESKDETGEKILTRQLKGKLEQFPDQKAIEDVVKQNITESVNRKGTSYRIILKLKSDHLRIRAEKYVSHVEKLCKKYQLNPALVMGIIHVESYFNPKAYNRKSGAVGLMQIVPRYAGKTMNKIMYNKDSEPDKASLFRVDVNLEMGTGYLAYIEKRFFREVSNVKSRYYCMICGYNSGPGTVLKLFSGVKKANRVFNERVNKLTAKGVYSMLRKDIPYKETREYLEKVREKSELFGGF